MRESFTQENALMYKFFKNTKNVEKTQWEVTKRYMGNVSIQD